MEILLPWKGKPNTLFNLNTHKASAPHRRRKWNTEKYGGYGGGSLRGGGERQQRAPAPVSHYTSDCKSISDICSNESVSHILHYLEFRIFYC